MTPSPTPTVTLTPDPPVTPQAVARLEAEPDLARMTEFFSYEHFYVIDCKFRELDLDGDLLIDACDLGRYGDGGEGGAWGEGWA